MNQSYQRFMALDVFRGMTICLMIIVNTPGSYETTFSPLLHANWHGFTPTDLVFPSFMFAVGNAMSFVMRKWETMRTAQVVTKILKRGFLIFLLGYLMYWFPFFTKDESGHMVLSHISNTRIFGVLQRIGLAYIMASLMLYFFKTRTTIIITAAILILYWPVMMYFGTGSDPLDIHTNAVLRFDTWLTGTNHLYMGEGFPFDPEGLLSTFPSIGNVVAGFIAGSYIQKTGKNYEGLAKLLMAGVILLIIAHWWGYMFPINKKLWTSTFVLHTTALDCMILACIIYVIDFMGKTKGVYFFEVFGKNPLAIYLLSELLAIIFYMININGINLHDWLYKNIFSLAGAYWGSLFYAMWFMLTCWAVGLWLDKKKVYIRV